MVEDIIINELVDTMRQVWKLIRKQAFSSQNNKTTFLQRHSLRYLSQNPDITQKQFAQYFGMSASSTAQFIERLLKLGYVKKTQDIKDKRIVRLSLSSLGEKEWKAFQDEKKVHIKEALAGMMKKDIQEYLRIQKKFLEVLQAKS